MPLQIRRMYIQFIFICLYLLSILFLTIFLEAHLFNQFWRPISLHSSNSTSHPSITELPSPNTTHQLSIIFIDNSTLTYFHPVYSSPAQVMERGVWTVHPMGRFGNLMGAYATLYALAKLSGHQACIHPHMYKTLAPIFRITLPVISIELFHMINWRDIHMHDWMSEDYRHIQGKYVRLRGYFSSYTFYDHIRQEILQEFTFHDHIKEEANQYLLSLCGQGQNVIYVGVHVRRGDYVNVMPRVWKGVVADRGYLETAMNYFRERYSNVIFVVTSNGMEWCRENINVSTGDVYFAGDGEESSPGMDFALLAHCNHTIMTIGTFGIWAAYLAGGETIYLANYTLPDSPFHEVFKPEATFLPDWIGIQADLSPLFNLSPSPTPSSPTPSHLLKKHN